MSDSYLVAGTVTNAAGEPINGLLIKAYDVDLLTDDDFLGEGETTRDGSFTILYRKDQFVKNIVESFTEGGPDIVLRIYDHQGYLIHTTKRRSGAHRFEKYQIAIDT